MRTINLALAAGAAILCNPAISAAEEPVGQLISDALKLHAAGKAEQAYKMLSAASTTNAGNIDFDYALGLASADSGHLGEAVIAFQRVLATSPNHAQARAELARVYALSGDIDTARREFDTVSGDPSIPDPVRSRFNRLVRGFDTEMKGGGNKLAGFFEAEGGYDGNINTATDATSITLPVFAFLGPAALNGAARNIDAGFYQLQGGISGSTGIGRQTRLYLSALGNWRDNLKSSAFDQASATGSISIAHSLHNGDALSVSAQGQRFWLGHVGYRASYGVTGQYTKRLKNDRALSFSAQYFRLDYDGNNISDANRFGGAITYAGKVFYTGIGGGKEQTRRVVGDHLSHFYANAQIGTEYPISERLAVLAGASVEHRNHDANDPLFLKARKDTQLDGSLGLRYVLKKSISIRPRVTYTRNFSNIALNDYDRVTASVGVRFEF